MTFPCSIFDFDAPFLYFYRIEQLIMCNSCLMIDSTFLLPPLCHEKDHIYLLRLRAGHLTNPALMARHRFNLINALPLSYISSQPTASSNEKIIEKIQWLTFPCMNYITSISFPHAYESALLFFLYFSNYFWDSYMCSFLMNRTATIWDPYCRKRCSHMQVSIWSNCPLWIPVCCISCRIFGGRLHFSVLSLQGEVYPTICSLPQYYIHRIFQHCFVSAPSYPFVWCFSLWEFIRHETIHYYVDILQLLNLT